MVEQMRGWCQAKAGCQVRILQTLLILAVTVELESIAPSPSCTARSTNSVVELVALPKATALAAR
ncbi:hypothetical protein D623_10034594 [Myotis brandtii]|uniref:Uncharacterized protein n=1 Tax=Myotis brandtii TaxID=109478 RepID=S7MPG9_MYOBR|nr:hypothetical protein D623_10034594 [Myotis brandtii]